MADDIERAWASLGQGAGRLSSEALRVPAPHLSDPGLYAIYGGGEAWASLGLGSPPDERPLYVGKHERDAFGRVAKHFAGKTGWSSPRRSLAALLHDALGLKGIPRTPDKPGYFANYGLSDEHEKILSEWMGAHLTCAVWPRPSDASTSVGQIETGVKWKVEAPLNIARGDPITPWTEQVGNARKVLAAEARAWRP
jgi:hypothetical protein